MTALGLAILALLLAGPVPVMLSRARWTTDVPRAAVVLWQAVALAAVLAAIGAGLAVFLDAAAGLEPGPVSLAIQVAALVLSCVVAARLVWAIGAVAVRTRARRRRHRMLVDLLATPGAQGLSILRDDTPIAYCVPGVRDARVVVSSGALARLSSAELAAVIAHEQAHLRARHDLVLEAFTMLREAFPMLARGRTPLEQSGPLIEMLADDAACRRVGALPVARALVTLASSPAPREGLAAAATATLERVQRLGSPSRSRPVLAGATYLTAVAIVVVPTVTMALPLLERAGALLALWLG